MYWVIFYHINIENLFIQIIFPCSMFNIKISQFYGLLLFVVFILKNIEVYLIIFLGVMMFASYRHLKARNSSFSQGKK